MRRVKKGKISRFSLFFLVGFVLLLFIAGLVTVVSTVTRPDKSTAVPSNIVINSSTLIPTASPIPEKKEFIPKATCSKEISPGQTKYTFLREGDVWTYDNGTQKKLTDYKYNYSIVTPPDLSRIAYLSRPLKEIQFYQSCTGEGECGGGLTVKNIWLINFDGTNPRNITNDPRPVSELSFSPNGKYLSYVEWPNMFIVVDAGTGKIVLKQTLEGAGNVKYRWSGDNNTIVVAGLTRDTHESIDGLRVYYIELRIKTLKDIGFVPVSGFYPYSIDYSLSPDLRHIIFFGSRPDDNDVSGSKIFGYWLTDINGNNPTDIPSTKGEMWYVNFSWSSDGKNVAFFSPSDNNQNSAILNIYEVDSRSLKTMKAPHSSFLIWKNSMIYSNTRSYSHVMPVSEAGDKINEVNFKNSESTLFLDNAAEAGFGCQ